MHDPRDRVQPIARTAVGDAASVPTLVHIGERGDRPPVDPQPRAKGTSSAQTFVRVSRPPTRTSLPSSPRLTCGLTGGHSAKGEAHWHRRARNRAGWVQATAVLVDAEWHDGVRILIANEHQPTGRIDVEPGSEERRVGKECRSRW